MSDLVTQRPPWYIDDVVAAVLLFVLVVGILIEVVQAIDFIGKRLRRRSDGPASSGSREATLHDVIVAGLILGGMIGTALYARGRGMSFVAGVVCIMAALAVVYLVDHALRRSARYRASGFMRGLTSRPCGRSPRASS